jgi:alpha-D-ribose 1-methylphosphonate 5-triphosphate synthase subunit PhnI
MYVAVKGGEAAIDRSIALLDKMRRGDTAIPELSIRQIKSQLRLAVDRVMAEGSLYDADLAALAIKQASGDLVEAIYLLRAYRTTLPRLGSTLPLDTGAMRLMRRISAAFKDLPGGQVLGPTSDYTQRLLDFSLAAEQLPCDALVGADTGSHAGALPPTDTARRHSASNDPPGRMPRVTALLADQALLEDDPPQSDETPFDVSRQPLRFPADRAARLQNLARGDEGFLLSLAYSTQRGYAHSHPFAGEIRHGLVEIRILVPELGVPVSIGDIALTECQMINQFAGQPGEPPRFTRGYGLSFGHNERKAMAMALVDRSLRAQELNEPVTAPAQMQEFVLSHTDSLEASGFVQHLKLPHYVDFQSELELLRRLRREFDADREAS